MKVVVASGKGGTGKTTVAVNLALSLEGAQLLDCDVEEPDCQHFLDLNFKEEEYVKSFLPVIDDNKCNYCGLCGELCHWNAIVTIPQKVMVFPEICHGCGLCAHACPQDAISEEGRVIGRVQEANNEIKFYQGALEPGEPLAPPLIRAVKKKAESETVIMDAPPGNACSAVAAVEGSDFCILVTEPTPFGLHDLKISVRMVNELGIPHGVIVNRMGIGDDRAEKYCKEEEIETLMKIPNDRKIAELYSRGIPFVKKMPEWKEKFTKLYDRILERIS